MLWSLLRASVITAVMDLSTLLESCREKGPPLIFFVNSVFFTCIKGSWNLEASAVTCQKFKHIFVVGLLSKNLLECIC